MPNVAYKHNVRPCALSCEICFDKSRKGIAPDNRRTEMGPNLFFCGLTRSMIVSKHHMQ